MITAALTATDIAAVVAAIVSLGAVVALTLVLASLTKVLREAQAAVRELGNASGPVIAEITALAEQAGDDFARVDDLIGSVEALASTVDSAARVGYLAVGKPVIKTVALARGTSRAAKRIRPPKVG